MQATVISTNSAVGAASPFPNINVSTATENKEVIFGVGFTSPNAFHTSTRGRGYVSGFVNLAAGDIVMILCQNGSPSSAMPISTNGTTRLKIFKLN